MAGKNLCADCGACGSGLPTAKGLTTIQQALCVIFCEVRKEFCEGKHKGKKKSTVAREKVGKSNALNRAIASKYGKGAAAIAEKMRMVPFKNAPKSWGRSPLSGDALKRHLKPLRDKLMAEVKEKLTKTLVKKVATGWMKLVPILNVLSTAYDVYDIASTGYDLYKSVDAAMKQYGGDIFRVNPDIAVEGPNGQLKEIHDFKFDGDKWQPGQKELYDKALKDSGSNGTAGEISQQTCKCDGAAKSGMAGV
jgi:hypothetical protein